MGNYKFYSSKAITEAEASFDSIQAEVDGVVVEVALVRSTTYSFQDGGQWVVKKKGMISAYEDERGTLLYKPEINRLMSQHFRHHSPLRHYESINHRQSIIGTTLDACVRYGFRTNGWCLVSESYANPIGTGAGSNRHRRVSPFFEHQEEAERILAALEEQERFGVTQAVIPTAAYPIIIPTRTRVRTGLNYYITAGDYNTCLYDDDDEGDNPWAVLNTASSDKK
jgi:hypothetical protein